MANARDESRCNFDLSLIEAGTTRCTCLILRPKIRPDRIALQAMARYLRLAGPKVMVSF
ncbi:hypothetical protein [Bradyrhizobium sp. CCGUVB14]|uniref:hypothetical protein n=1 Tax=Bradyrhizobium sp. CCGUVB14 TaxID=2949628 RepID=UPI0020B2B513|nr:hypothetical protein [Bradyrhizobium sp. CCGUVB14]MCP3439639.1 hypothetical protein [Bradyrhizobium sp. CCGUVB14]